MNGTATLDMFFGKERRGEGKEEIQEQKMVSRDSIEMLRKIEEQRLEELRKIATKEHKKLSSNRAFLLGIDYDPDLNVAIVKFYDIDEKTVFILHDGMNHRPYFLTDLPPDKVRELAAKYNMLHSVVAIEEVEKYDPISDRNVKLRKVVVRTPQDVGGSGGRKGLRSIVGEDHSWEARIKYYLCYLYDNLSLIHISEPTRQAESRMPSSA